jgi:dipeptidyl aminopeptidase/acylaminoacyl peptidase
MDEHAAALGCRTGHSAPDSPESRLLGGPITTRPALAREASPLTYASPDDPPFFIQHGTADCTVPYPQSELLRDALRLVTGVERVEFGLLAGAGHGGPAFTAPANVERAISFLARHLAP